MKICIILVDVMTFPLSEFYQKILTENKNLNSNISRASFLLLNAVVALEFLSLKFPHDRIVIQMIGNRPTDGIQFRYNDQGAPLSTSTDILFDRPDPAG